MKILAFGEILWDVIKGDEHLGGAPLNFAAHAARCGNEAWILSRLGDDFRGLRAHNKCKDYGVNNSLVQWDEEHPTGIVNVVLEKGQPDYTIIENVAYDFIKVEPTLRGVADHFDVFYFGSLVQRNTESAVTLKFILQNFTFKHVFYDVNLRKGGFNERILKSSLSSCTILKLNTDEVPTVSSLIFSDQFDVDTFCKAVTVVYPNIRTIVITASENGCFIFDESKKLKHIPVKKVEVNDAVGAGDAFSAAFLHILYEKRDAVFAANVANELGSYVTTQRGAIPEYTREVRALIQGDTKTKSDVAKIIL
jgi:fructokinase